MVGSGIKANLATGHLAQTTAPSVLPANRRIIARQAVQDKSGARAQGLREDAEGVGFVLREIIIPVIP